MTAAVVTWSIDEWAALCGRAGYKYMMLGAMRARTSWRERRLTSVAWLVEADGVQQSMRMLALMHLEDAANVVVEIVSLLDL